MQPVKLVLASAATYTFTAADQYFILLAAILVRVVTVSRISVFQTIRNVNFEPPYSLPYLPPPTPSPPTPARPGSRTTSPNLPSPPFPSPSARPIRRPS